MVPCNRAEEDALLSKSYMQEAKHYMDTYGTHAEYLAYLLKHRCFVTAARHILDLHITKADSSRQQLSEKEKQQKKNELFVMALCHPCLEKPGDLLKILDAMKSLNHSLDRWVPFIEYLCNYVNKTGRYQALYTIQCFTEV